MNNSHSEQSLHAEILASCGSTLHNSNYSTINVVYQRENANAGLFYAISTDTTSNLTNNIE